MKRTNIYFTDEQHELLMAERQRTGAPIAEIVRRAVDACFGQSGGSRLPPKPPPSPPPPRKRRKK